VPIFETILYTRHALERMGERGIGRADVELTLRIGEGRPGKRDTWIYELGSWRVIIVEEKDSARVITVVRLRGRT
jgi:hypothetical protein